MSKENTGAPSLLPPRNSQKTFSSTVELAKKVPRWVSGHAALSHKWSQHPEDSTCGLEQEDLCELR